MANLKILTIFTIISAISTGHFCLDEKAKNCINVDGSADKIVCVCNRTHCDWLDYEFPTKSGTVNVIESSRQGARFKVTKLELTKSHGFEEQKENGLHTIQVDLSSSFQQIIGWGGAFTDAAGSNIVALSAPTQENLLKSYFHRNGLRYNMGRVPIGGCDFSLRNYTLDDLPDGQVDYNLTNWSLTDEEHKYKLPIIRRANQLQAEHTGHRIKLFGSPWSPPSWMKDNHNLTRGHLIDDHRIYESYAKYLVKFYTSYKWELGFDFWGGTVQNEPVSAFFPFYFFNSLTLGNYQASKFIGQYLGPELERHGLGKKTFKLMVGDDTLGNINYQVPSVLSDKKVEKYVSGLAFHWYSSGWQEPYNKLTDCIEQIKDKIEFVLMTEACSGWRKGLEPAVDLGSWERGESYGVDIIQDLLRQSAGWIDWNLALDMSGGPNWVNNTVDSPIIVNKAKDEFYKQPMFYVLGHFSRFFTPGSVRVKTSPFTGGYNDLLMTVGAHNQELDLIVVNILNRWSTKQRVNLNIVGSKHFKANQSVDNLILAPRSISTVVIKL